jgi:hypothetical protein
MFCVLDYFKFQFQITKGPSAFKTKVASDGPWRLAWLVSSSEGKWQKPPKNVPSTQYPGLVIGHWPLVRLCGLRFVFKVLVLFFNALKRDKEIEKKSVLVF